MKREQAHLKERWWRWWWGGGGVGGGVIYATDYAKQLSFRRSCIPSLIEEGGEKTNGNETTEKEETMSVCLRQASLSSALAGN